MKKSSKTKPLFPNDPAPSSPPPQPDTRQLPLHDTIAQRAYFLWKNYGEPEQRAVDIWLEAERQLLGADSQVAASGTGSVSSPDLGDATSSFSSQGKKRQ